MTLHCNKVKLWTCPEWVAKMCMHNIWMHIPNPSEDDKHFEWALERYLIWANESSHTANAPYTQKFLDYLEKHVQEVLEAMKAPDLKVWME